ncbi:hypothetical protein WN48_05996 [Eufriesea mexicana]|nr:hypothetical protein WN48_05996 [Eufriesea mexicana]
MKVTNIESKLQPNLNSSCEIAAITPANILQHRNTRLHDKVYAKWGGTKAVEQKNSLLARCRNNELANSRDQPGTTINDKGKGFFQQDWRREENTQDDNGALSGVGRIYLHGGRGVATSKGLERRIAASNRGNVKIKGPMGGSDIRKLFVQSSRDDAKQSLATLAPGFLRDPFGTFHFAPFENPCRSNNAKNFLPRQA